MTKDCISNNPGGNDDGDDDNKNSKMKISPEAVHGDTSGRQAGGEGDSSSSESGGHGVVTCLTFQRLSTTTCPRLSPVKEGGLLIELLQGMR